MANNDVTLEKLLVSFSVSNTAVSKKHSKVVDLHAEASVVHSL